MRNQKLRGTADDERCQRRIYKRPDQTEPESDSRLSKDPFTSEASAYSTSPLQSEGDGAERGDGSGGGLRSHLILVVQPLRSQTHPKA